MGNDPSAVNSQTANQQTSDSVFAPLLNGEMTVGMQIAVQFTQKIAEQIKENTR
jgi:hypothetical protein